MQNKRRAIEHISLNGAQVHALFHLVKTGRVPDTVSPEHKQFALERRHEFQFAHSPLLFMEVNKILLID